MIFLQLPVDNFFVIILIHIFYQQKGYTFMKDFSKVWEEMLSIFKTELNETSYKTWFAPLSQKNIDKDLKILYLECPDEFVRDVLNKRYSENLDQKAHMVLGDQYRVVVQLKSDEEDEEILIEKKIEENPKKILIDENFLNPRYNFENFVVGNNNKHARSAAFAVADNPSLTYNPLFLYGGSGLGKTHLMHAIGHYILKKYPEKNVLYVSSEMFTNELIKSLEDNKKTRMRAFKNKYRNLDVLLIDDIQFIEGKEATQEEFFHTFNALYDMNKQIIISSDRAPNKLTKLDDRLTSRFQWNLTVDIQPPDYETRVAILKRKAEEENLEIDDELMDVINLIAEKIKFNIRELEGAFTRITSFAAIMNEKITMKFARNILKDIITSTDFNITCETIKKTVCKRFNIKMADIESSKRTRNLAFPRQIAMYLCREMIGTSLPKIGEAFGGKNHTTVLHAIDKISAEINENETTADLIESLKDEINEN